MIFNVENVKKYTVDDIIDDVYQIVEQEFANEHSLKRQVIKTDDSIRFSCPYCRDSMISDSKKRGNLYLNTMVFHCFNCNIHKPFSLMVRDFLNKRVPINEEKNYTFKSPIVITPDIVNNIFDEYGLSLPDVMDKLWMQHINYSTSGKTYLMQRGFVDFLYKDTIYYSKKLDLICFLNMYKDKVVGIIGRKIGNTTDKYRLYDIKRLNMLVYNKDINIATEFNQLSTYFNLFKIKINQKIYITEGTIDCLFLPNSVSANGVNNLERIVQYLNKYKNKLYIIIDNDESGYRIGEKLLNKGYNVLLWKKLLKDNKIYTYIKDINDLYLYDKTLLKKIDLYFTDNILDKFLL